MLMRTDRFREFDRLTQQAFGTRMRPAVMPMDAYREGFHFVVHFDLPGVDPTSIDVTVEKNVLTVSAERSWQANDNQQVLASERPQGPSAASCSSATASTPRRWRRATTTACSP